MNDIPDRIVEFLYSDILYKEELVKLIDLEGVMHTAESFAEVQRHRRECTIKVEGMERIFRSVYMAGQELAEKHNHDGPVTCHLFWALKDSPSFDLHTDPYDVFLKVLVGEKVMEVDGEDVSLRPENEVYRLKGNTLHKAKNTHESWMLSFGLDNFIDERELL